MRIKQLGATIVFLAGSGWALAQSSPPAPSDNAAAPAAARDRVQATPVADAKPVGTPAQTPTLAPVQTPAGCNGIDGCRQDHGYKHYNPEDEIPYSLNSCLYGNIEYIMWWQKGTEISTLIDTGVAATIEKSQSDFGGRSGARVTAGFFIDPVQDCGFETTFLWLGKGDNATTVASDINGFPGIPRSRIITVFDFLGNPSLISIPVSEPRNFSGSVTQVSDTGAWGAEANARFRCCSLFADRTYFLAGFRHFQLNEGIQVSDVSTVLPTIQPPLDQVLFPGSQIRAFDNFTVHNQFYGVQIGGAAEYYYGRCSLDFIWKFAFGDVHEAVAIRGTTVYQPVGGAPTVTPRGALATPANIGTHQRDIFAWLPEATLNVGYQFTPNLKGYVGYNYLFLSDAIRAGNLTGGTFSFNPKNYYAQGFNVGLQLRY